LNNNVKIGSGEGKIEGFDSLISVNTIKDSGHEDGNVPGVDFVHGGNKLSELFFVFGELEHPFMPEWVVT
jgi:hypothetical protein